MSDMNASFSIQVDAPRHLVRMTMSGFFTGDDIARFVAARDEAHKQLLCGPNQHLTLVDISGMNIQTQDSVAAFQQVMANPATTSRRIAFIVAKSLARSQIKRATESRQARYFMDREAAEQWLFSD